MNGKSIEELLALIDCNIDLTQGEAAQYIRTHQGEIALSLASTGSAVVKTKAGELHLSLADLEPTAA